MRVLCIVKFTVISGENGEQAICLASDFRVLVDGMFFALVDAKRVCFREAGKMEKVVTTTLRSILTLGVVACGFAITSAQEAHAINPNSVELNKVASIVFETEREMETVKEEMSRVALTRAAPRVKKEKATLLGQRHEMLKQRNEQARRVFSQLAASKVFDEQNPQHVGGAFQLEGNKGEMTCLSSTGGVSGQCTVNSENITFSW